MISNQAKILIIDDSRTNRIFLEKQLQKAGFSNISQSIDGEQGLEMIAVSPPDLIILDIVMPKIDGFEVCRRTKENPLTKMIPIIMVTGLDDYDAKLKCLRYGADDLLNKPVKPPELLARVNTLVHVKQYFDELQRLNQQMIDNLKTAGRIQRALLPKQFPKVNGLEFDAYYQPTECIGGDYYNVFSVDKENICMYIADVMGHQFDGAMLTVFVKEFISGYSKRVVEMGKAFSPAECLTELDIAFKKEGFPADLFVTLFITIFNVPTSMLTFSAAGFAQPPIVYGVNGIRELRSEGKLIMALDCIEPFKENKTKLQQGEGVFFYTDGIVEEFNEANNEQFGYDRLYNIFATLELGNEQELIPVVLRSLKQFSKRESFTDDIALINFFRRS